MIASSFYVAPIRSTSGSNIVLSYNSTTYEVGWITTTTLPSGQFYSNYLFWSTGTTPASWQSENGDRVHIGSNAGSTSQQSGAVAVGQQAGVSSQQTDAIALGNFSGMFNQGASSIAIGRGAGYSNQSTAAIAIGNWAANAQFSQGVAAIAIGLSAGETNQGRNAIAIGWQTGQSSQSTSAIAIGQQAGQFGQGQNEIAIGVRAAQNNNNIQAAFFDNTFNNLLSNYVSTTSYSMLPTSFDSVSITFWVNLTAAPTQNFGMNIFSFVNPVNNRSITLGLLNTGSFSWYLDNSNSQTLTFGAGSINTNVWYFVSAVVSAANNLLYLAINSAAGTTSVAGTLLPIGSGTLNIGTFPGLLQDFRIYNSSFSQTNFQSISSLQGYPTNPAGLPYPVIWYPFNNNIDSFGTTSQILTQTGTITFRNFSQYTASINQSNNTIAIGTQAGNTFQGVSAPAVYAFPVTPIINFDASTLTAGSVTNGTVWNNLGSLTCTGYISGPSGVVLPGPYTNEVFLPANTRFSTTTTGTGIPYPTFTAAFVYRISTCPFFLEHGLNAGAGETLASYYISGAAAASGLSPINTNVIYYYALNRNNGTVFYQLDAGVQYGGGPIIPYGYIAPNVGPQNNYVIQIISFSAASAITQYYVSSTRTTVFQTLVTQGGAWGGTVPSYSTRSLNMNHRSPNPQFVTNILFFSTTFTQTQMNDLQSYLIERYLTPRTTIINPGSIAIGPSAGQSNQGQNTIAIGPSAGQISQSTNTIVINATGIPLNTPQQNGLFITPIRLGNGNASLNYNTQTGEITFNILDGQPYIASPINNSYQMSFQLGSGLIIKFGIGAFLANNATLSILFTTPFSTYCNAVSVTMNLIGVTPSYCLSSNNITRTGFTINSMNAVQNYPSWIALGW